MSRGGGMADASDLKSDNLKKLCGFDSHPRHHDLEMPYGKDT